MIGDQYIFDGKIHARDKWVAYAAIELDGEEMLFSEEHSKFAELTIHFAEQLDEYVKSCGKEKYEAPENALMNGCPEELFHMLFYRPIYKKKKATIGIKFARMENDNL